MARIRTVKPELFLHEDLSDLSWPARLAFIGLFCVSDREGRFVWRPKTLKVQVLPHDALDFKDVLEELRTAGFVEMYTVDSQAFGWIPTWRKHQRLDKRNESPSKLPPPPGWSEETDIDPEPEGAQVQKLDESKPSTRRKQDVDSIAERKGKEEERNRKGKGKEEQEKITKPMVVREGSEGLATQPGRAEQSIPAAGLATNGALAIAAEPSAGAKVMLDLVLGGDDGRRGRGRTASPQAFGGLSLPVERVRQRPREHVRASSTPLKEDPGMRAEAEALIADKKAADKLGITLSEFRAQKAKGAEGSP